ncbi:alpha/beta fold hydrolase [Algimonas porphyrae]|uniref:Alpha/beta hydrolase n=1 Tax=Algimonas porphyrae TaxID=1128113 RepID=A0ABQ5V4T2_9PROT|nr:alpha/beta hydrolase [Algimonas porphyrae]GLQ22090.1 hypothetical protein GCM10007854_30450 [Algimonas porphyrae]
MTEMGRDRLVIALDTPGYGDSAHPPEPLTIKAYATALHQGLMSLGCLSEQKLDLLGYHTGTLIAVEMAILHPDTVGRLLLPGIPFYEKERQIETYERLVKPEMLSPDGSHLDTSWSFATLAMNAGVTLERGQEHFGDLMQAYPYGWWAYHGVFTYDGEEQFPKVTQPILLMTTEASLKAETEAAQTLFPQAKLTHFPGLTYGIFDVGVSQIATAVRDFLDSPEGDAPFEKRVPQ